MAFTSYAAAADVDSYLAGAKDGLWGGVTADVEDSLARAAKKINERLRGLDRFSDDGVPIAQESDGAYAEVLVQLNVYMAIQNQLKSTQGGEVFEDKWKWLFVEIRDIWKAIEDGKYKFGSEPAESSSGAKAIELGRSSP